MDRYTRTVLTVIAGLLTVIAVELAYHAPSSTPRAEAQIPDTALQRKQVVDESRETNRLLSAILEHLRTKPIKVETQATDTRKSGVGPTGQRTDPRG
jgi:hypothetical protein